MTKCICPAGCDCQNPDPQPGAVRLVSENCPVHNWRPYPVPCCPVTGIHVNGAIDTDELAREIRTMIAARPSVHIAADEDSVYVKVGEETFSFEYPGTLTGADLEKVLTAIGVPVEYEWQGTDCTEYDMEGYPI